MDESREPEVIRPREQRAGQLQPLVASMQAGIESLLGHLPLSDFPRNIDYADLNSEEKADVDALMDRRISGCKYIGD